MSQMGSDVQFLPNLILFSLQFFNLINGRTFGVMAFRIAIALIILIRRLTISDTRFQTNFLISRVCRNLNRASYAVDRGRI